MPFLTTHQHLLPLSRVEQKNIEANHCFSNHSCVVQGPAGHQWGNDLPYAASRWIRHAPSDLAPAGSHGGQWCYQSCQPPTPERNTTACRFPVVANVPPQPETLQWHHNPYAACVFQRRQPLIQYLYELPLPDGTSIVQRAAPTILTEATECQHYSMADARSYNSSPLMGKCPYAYSAAPSTSRSVYPAPIPYAGAASRPGQCHVGCAAAGDGDSFGTPAPEGQMSGAIHQEWLSEEVIECPNTSDLGCQPMALASNPYAPPLHQRHSLRWVTEGSHTAAGDASGHERGISAVANHCGSCCGSRPAYSPQNGGSLHSTVLPPPHDASTADRCHVALNMSQSQQRPTQPSHVPLGSSNCPGWPAGPQQPPHHSHWQYPTFEEDSEQPTRGPCSVATAAPSARPMPKPTKCVVNFVSRRGVGTPPALQQVAPTSLKEASSAAPRRSSGDTRQEDKSDASAPLSVRTPRSNQQSPIPPGGIKREVLTPNKVAATPPQKPAALASASLPLTEYQWREKLEPLFAYRTMFADLSVVMRTSTRSTHFVPSPLATLRSSEPIMFIYLIDHKCRQTPCVSAYHFAVGETVVIEGDLGIDMGVVDCVVHRAEFEAMSCEERQDLGFPAVDFIITTCARIYRKATAAEVKHFMYKLPEMENALLRFLRERVSKCVFHTCEVQYMEFLQCEIQADVRKVYVYYNTSRKVFFRELAKFLFTYLHCRIWMHEVSHTTAKGTHESKSLGVRCT